jgi:hypothetical protein
MKKVDCPMCHGMGGYTEVIYPVQCSCGHLFLEQYQFSEVTKEGHIGFCWCGFCRTKLMVKPYSRKIDKICDTKKLSE